MVPRKECEPTASQTNQRPKVLAKPLKICLCRLDYQNAACAIVQLKEGNKKVKACVPNFCAAWSTNGGCKTRSVAMSGNVRTPALFIGYG
jgi:hypothetical protein